MSVRLSVRMKNLASHWMDFNEVWYLSIFPKFIEKVQVSLQYDNINDTLNEDEYTFFIICRSVLLIMSNDSGKVVEKTKTHLIFNSFSFFR